MRRISILAALFSALCFVSPSEAAPAAATPAASTDAVELEFFVEAQLVSTFGLTQLDDTTWVGFEDWPAGHSFDSCVGDHDFVCVAIRGDDEARQTF